MTPYTKIQRKNIYNNENMLQKECYMFISNQRYSSEFIILLGKNNLGIQLLSVGASNKILLYFKKFFSTCFSSMDNTKKNNEKKFEKRKK